MYLDINKFQGKLLKFLLIIPGTCVNNTSVMMFKKGGFEVSPVVYPVAIKVSYVLTYLSYMIDGEKKLIHFVPGDTGWGRNLGLPL